MFNRDDYLSIKEAAEQAKVSGESVRRWIRKGYIDQKWVEVHASQYYVHKQGFQDWCEEMKRLKISPEGGILARARFALR